MPESVAPSLCTLETDASVTSRRPGGLEVERPARRHHFARRVFRGDLEEVAGASRQARESRADVLVPIDGYGLITAGSVFEIVRSKTPLELATNNFRPAIGAVGIDVAVERRAGRADIGHILCDRVGNRDRSGRREGVDPSGEPARHVDKVVAFVDSHATGVVQAGIGVTGIRTTEVPDDDTFGVELLDRGFVSNVEVICGSIDNEAVRTKAFGDSLQ